MAWGIALTAGLGLAAAVLLALLARGILRRPAGGHRGARNAHALGWAMLAAMVGADSLRVLLGLLGDGARAGYLALVYVKIVATSVAFLGFGLYVLYIWTGRLRWAVPLSVLAGLHALAFVVFTTARLPFTVVVGAWTTRMRLLGDGIGVLPQSVGLVLFFAPTVVIALAYLLLLPRLTDRTQRLRVALVAVGVIAFQVAGTVQSNPDTSPDDPVGTVFTGVLLAAALLATAAYHPPRAARRRWGLRGLDEETDVHEVRPGKESARDARRA